MKVGLVVYGPLDQVSGGYLYDRRLVEYLRAQGDHVEVISLPFRNHLVNAGKNFSADLISRFKHPSWDILLQDELCHPSLFLANALRAKNLSIVSIVHHLKSRERPGSLGCGWMETRYLGTADAFIFNSAATAKSVEDVLGRLPPHIIAPPGKDSLPSIGTLSATSTESLRIIFVGNVIRRKGLHLLLEALVSIQDVAWELKVIGDLTVDRRYAKSLRRKVFNRGLEKRVRFYGRLAKKELAEMMRSSDVLAVPSLYEGFGICYLEAMGQGLAVIATRNGGSGEIITDGKEGFLVAPDIGEIAVRIRQIGRDRGLLSFMRFNALKKFDQLPCWDESCRRIRKFLTAACFRFSSK